MLRRVAYSAANASAGSAAYSANAYSRVYSLVLAVIVVVGITERTVTIRDLPRDVHSVPDVELVHVPVRLDDRRTELVAEQACMSVLKSVTDLFVVCYLMTAKETTLGNTQLDALDLDEYLLGVRRQ